MTEPKPQKAVVYHDADKGTVGVVSEKRGLSRIAVDVPVMLTVAGKLNAGVLLDYSGSGGRLKTDAKADLGQLVELSIARGSSPFVAAKVSRKHPTRNEIGVEWVQWYDESALRGMLAKKQF